LKKKIPKIERWVLAPHALSRMEELTQVITQPDSITPQGPKWILKKKLPARDDHSIAAVLLEKRRMNYESSSQ
jgi:hypothetical protein